MTQLRRPTPPKITPPPQPPRHAATDGVKWMEDASSDWLECKGRQVLRSFQINIKAEGFSATYLMLYCFTNTVGMCD